ncbi:membrane protein [Salmonella enterica subsp. enterica]|nr:membrane protein [Salmonella enterica subsp. enterica]
MTWSGRIIADYTSALILYTRSQLVYSISAAVSTLVFCYFIVKTPSGTLRWNKSDYLLFPLIFFTYWISNPNLGQTTFWIVGAANYLWTNLFVVVWLFFFYTITIKNSKAISPWVALLSFMAGCSN